MNLSQALHLMIISVRQIDKYLIENEMKTVFKKVILSDKSLQKNNPQESHNTKSRN
jgi:hypothetical protein